MTIRPTQLLLIGSALLLSGPIASRAAAQPDEDPPPRDPPPRDTGEEPPTHRLAEAETAYTGALILEGGVDVTLGGVGVGDQGVDIPATQSARFIGNTLYAESTDQDGNAVAMVVEFYWFESSVPRGSDFFVGVVKARTIPHLAAGWVLEHDPAGPTERFRPDRGATLYVRAETDPTLEHGGFRWDWSLPFRDYGMDAYGTIRMRADYGVGLMGNGAAQAAYQVTDEGYEVEVDGQTTGHLTADYNVNTNYEVTLYRWDVYTRNSARMLEWSLFLRTADREAQNADHHYFIAMQTPEDSEFTLSSLEVGGSIKRKINWWWDEHRSLSVRVDNLIIRRPANTNRRNTSPRTDREDREDDPTPPWEREDDEDPGSEDDFGWPEEDAFAGEPPACTVGWGQQGTGTVLWGGLVVLVLVARRRKQ